MKDVDLFVIGGGSGGVRAARVAASHGAKVMLAEEHRIGGTCVIRGCVPKKLFVYASRFAGEFKDAAGFGWMVQNTSFDWGTLVANKDREIARLEAAYTGNLDRVGVEHVKSRASFDDSRTVRLEASGELVRASNVLIATGVRLTLFVTSPTAKIPGAVVCEKRSTFTAPAAVTSTSARYK